MGYNLHITRKNNWRDPEGPPITPEEWLTVTAADPKLEPYEGDVNDPYFVTWQDAAGNKDQWLDLDVEDGGVYTKNPDDALIEKMVQIAKLLGAKVQGDDGETYLGDGQVVE